MSSKLSFICSLLLIATPTISASETVARGRARHAHDVERRFKGAQRVGSHLDPREDGHMESIGRSSLPRASLGGPYQLAECYTGDDFFDSSKWTFMNISDPTHGAVNYTDAATAKALGLAYVDREGHAIMKVDTSIDFDQNITKPLRPSVRIQSVNQYNGGLFVLDAVNYPWGCSVWPAFWMKGPNWPNSGEIDIFEGINLRTVNQYTAHTATNCTLDADPPKDFQVSNHSSTLGLTDCHPSSGCYWVDNDPQTYGEALNAAGGQVLAFWWADDGLRIFAFPRYRVPLDLTANIPNPSLWDHRYLKASWAAPTCPTTQFFKNMWMIFDITLCGDWANAADVWPVSGCPGSCYDTARYGENFKDAFWKVNYVKVFEPAEST